jgi:plastocyanin
MTQRSINLWGGLCALLWAPAWGGNLSVLVQDDAGKPLGNAVVQLKSPAAARAAKSGVAPAIVQRDKAFHPQVTVITTGTSVSFPNEDSVRHHVYSFSPAKRFELKLYSGTPSAPVVFDKPGVVVLGCNIHDHMVAWVHVVDTPYHGTTDGQGRLNLTNVPNGRYQMQVWHQRLSPQAPVAAQTIDVGAAERTLPITLTGLLPP